MTRLRLTAVSFLFVVFLQAQTLPCFRDKTTADQCPKIGCAQENTSEAEANEARRNTSLSAGEPLHLKVDDFEALQAEANTKGLQGFAVPLHKRRELYGRMKTLRPQAGREAGEGSKVELRGYIVGTPHARRADPANCRLVGRGNNSFRINIAELPDNTEFDSVLVEMIPYHRNIQWTLEKLRCVAWGHFQVRVIGQLFYDSKHLVNSDPDDELQRHPKRLSLWEIHPVTEFWYCDNKCEWEGELTPRRSTGGWHTLESMASIDDRHAQADCAGQSGTSK